MHISPYFPFLHMIFRMVARKIVKGERVWECLLSQAPVVRKECSCCIEVEESLVLIFCGEIDVDNLREALNAYAQTKNAAKADAVE